MMRSQHLLILGFGLAMLTTTPSATADDAPAKYRVYFGTYTRGGGGSQGIYQAVLDMKTGKLSEPEVAAETVNPSFVAIHPSNRYLYSVGEVENLGDRKRTGGVNAFAIDPTNGRLVFLNQQESGGAGPCHLIVDPEGKNVLVANYGGGSAAVLPIQDGGQLAEASDFEQHEGSSVNPQRQEGPHAHSINLDPMGKRAFVADLGLDKVLIYEYDPVKGQLTPNDPASAELAPGAGPRHFAFHPSGNFAFVINELSSTLTAFRYDADTGAMSEADTASTLPADFDGDNTTAEVRVHPNGKFVYGSNRGHDSIAMFRFDESTGKLTLIGNEPTGGQTPRNFNLDPTGQYLLAANQANDLVVVFQVDPETGKLTAVDRKRVPSPVCVRFLPIGE